MAFVFSHRLRTHRNPWWTKLVWSRCPWDCVSLDAPVLAHLTLTGVHREGGSVVCGHWPPCSVHRSRGLWLLSAWLRLWLWSIPSSECLLWLVTAVTKLTMLQSTINRHQTPGPTAWPILLRDFRIHIFSSAHSAVASVLLLIILFVAKYAAHEKGITLSPNLIVNPFNRVYKLVKCLKYKGHDTKYKL